MLRRRASTLIMPPEHVLQPSFLDDPGDYVCHFGSLQRRSHGEGHGCRFAKALRLVCTECEAYIAYCTCQARLQCHLCAFE